MATTQTNSQFSLNVRDLARGLLLAVISAVLTAVLPIFQAGDFKFNWPAIGAVAGTTAISYLIKNYFTASEVVVKDVPQSVVNAVKDGVPVKVGQATFTKEEPVTVNPTV